MNPGFRKILLVGGLIIVFGIGAVMVTSFTNQALPAPSMEPSTQSQNTTESNLTQNETVNSKIDESKYVHYSKGVLEPESQSKRVLFFYASWCPTCRPVDTYLSQNSSEIPEDIQIIRVNYNDPDTDDEEKALARTYGVTYQHTFVQINGEGEEITKWNGGGLSEIIANIQ